jgi:1,4-dihydroxy-2-naphthoate polyprenyltransferase
MRQPITVWYQAIRPFSLGASIVPVVVGSALAMHAGSFSWFIFFLVLLGSILVQCGTNLVDEYADHQDGIAQHKVQAPYKVIARGLLSRQQVQQGAFICFGMAALIGVYLVTRAGWPLGLVCIASVAVAYGYSAGPYPLGKLAIGELLVFIFMGPVMVLSTFYVQTHTLTWPAVWLSLPVACLVTAILVANDLRDVEEDQHSGKITIVTLWGRPSISWLFLLLLAVSFGSLVILVASGIGSWLWLAPLLLLPQGIKIAQLVWQQTERPILHQALRSTAQLHLRFGLLLALTLALSPLVR